MRIYVLLLNRRRPFYYAEPVAAAKSDPPRADWRSRLEARWSTWQQRLRTAEGAAGSILRRVEAFLRRFESPDEPIFRALRWTPNLTLVHPERLDPEDVRHGWTTELRRQTRKHAFWFLVNVLVCPPTLLLALLPGPNLIGYWFLYRAGAHAMTLVGLWRARRGAIPTTLHADPALDQPLRHDRRVDPQIVESLSTHCGLIDLRGFLIRRGWLREPAASTSPVDPS